MSRLRYLRELNDESIADLARYLNIPPGTVGKWDRDEREMDYHTLVKLSEHYDVSIDYLIGRDYELRSLPREEASLLSAYRSLSLVDKKRVIKIVKVFLEKEVAP